MMDVRDRLLQRGGRPCVVGAVSDGETWRQVCSSCAGDLPCDVVELRVDALLPEVDVRELLSCRCPRPVLLTIRHAEEGGKCAWDDDRRMELALELLPMASMLDWEAARLPQSEELVEAVHAMGKVLVASSHDFDRTPSLEQLLSCARSACGAGADVVKFAFRLGRPEDMMVGVELLRSFRDAPLAVMGMGPFAFASRLLYAELGSCLLYGYLGGNRTAPGQWSAEMCSSAVDALY